MSLPPLVERELGAVARRGAFFWLRGLLALAAGFQAQELLSAAVAGPPSANGVRLLRAMAGLVFVAALLLGLLAADSIARERRAGTLGLLLLTDLSPAEIVRGKLLSCGLTSFLVLLGVLPAFMVPVLLGGVTGAEAAMTGFGVLNALFVAQAAGLWMSARFRERRYAIGATLALVGALAFGAEIIGGAMFGPSARSFCQMLGLSGWRSLANMSGTWVPTPGGGWAFAIWLYPLALFGLWFVILHACGWLFLRRAAVALAANWQDQPEEHFRKPEPVYPWAQTVAVAGLGDEDEPAADAGSGSGLARFSWLSDPRPWDADPIRWRMEQLGSTQGLVWFAVGVNFFAQFGAFGSVFYGSSALGGAWGVLSFIGMVAIAVGSGMLAWTGARFFQQTRAQHDLELLLTTPLGSRNMLIGQWQVLRHELTAPLAVVLALALPAAAMVGFNLVHGYHRDAWFLLPPLLIALNVAAEAVALCSVGMWWGLRGRNLTTAVVGTVVLVELLPLALATLGMCGWSLLTPHSVPELTVRAAVPAVVPALLFFLAKNLGLIVWARWRLQGELRLRLRLPGLALALRRLVLRPS